MPLARCRAVRRSQLAERFERRSHNSAVRKEMDGQDERWRTAQLAVLLEQANMCAVGWLCGLTLRRLRLSSWARITLPTSPFPTVALIDPAHYPASVHHWPFSLDDDAAQKKRKWNRKKQITRWRLENSPFPWMIDGWISQKRSEQTGTTTSPPASVPSTPVSANFVVQLPALSPLPR
jgi:hypothetical protein